jgi:tRNA threonylcarbamoyladenosine biosynthesis protein TsaB
VIIVANHVNSSMATCVSVALDRHQESDMTVILAVDTATEACSVALAQGDIVHERYAVAPRRHNQLLFGMLRELLSVESLAESGVEAVAYSSGPGSFTGLRIAASAAQGLCFSAGLPAVPVPSLEVVAQTALSDGVVQEREHVLCMIDARINEVYAAVCRFEDGLALCVEGPWACAPYAVDTKWKGDLVAVGSGAQFIDDLPGNLRERVLRVAPEILPRASAMVPLARRSIDRRDTQTAAQVSPVYVRDEINWKKIPQQGRAS